MYSERIVSRLGAVQIEEAAAAVAARETDPYTVVEGWLRQGEE
jgi:hypothetical protein